MAVVFKPHNQAATGSTLDRAAICVSAVCLAQCLLLPGLVAVSPLISLGFLDEELFHLSLLAVILPVSLIAFYLGFRIHRNSSMLIPGLAGLGIVVMAVALGHDVLGTLGTALLTSFGGMLLMIGHWLNLRRRREACLQPQT
jgi:hypothetical protein